MLCSEAKLQENYSDKAIMAVNRGLINEKAKEMNEVKRGLAEKTIKTHSVGNNRLLCSKPKY